MKTRRWALLGVATTGILILLGSVYGAQEAPESITMESEVFSKHKKALVVLTHKKHSEDYKIPCSDCHHVYKDGKNVWKTGDEVQKCTVCHSEGKAPKAKEGEPKLSKKEKIQKYYYSAIHANCTGCHKALKKAAKPTGPTACKGCHPKKK